MCVSRLNRLLAQGTLFGLLRGRGLELLCLTKGAPDLSGIVLPLPPAPRFADLTTLIHQPQSAAHGIPQQVGIGGIMNVAFDYKGITACFERRFVFLAAYGLHQPLTD